MSYVTPSFTERYRAYLEDVERSKRDKTERKPSFTERYRAYLEDVERSKRDKTERKPASECPVCGPDCEWM
jgi:predicted phage gp36 major capsid-like protein